MAKILQDILKEKIYIIKPEDLERPNFPTLLELKGKILLKNKGYFDNKNANSTTMDC
jgi:hypothetical protein